MKIGFSLDAKVDDADSGKHKFFIRLAKELENLGAVIDNKKHDIFICLPNRDMSKSARVNILRLDGLILNTRFDYRNINKKIVKSIKKSDAIIYQGKFCKKAYRKFLGIKKEPSIIIPNGASPSEFIPRNVGNYFLANCKWRPHKRLKDTVKSFLIALDMGLDSDLIITGKPDYKIKHDRIKYVGWQNGNNIKQLLSKSIASLHLSWLDWCPNAMIEAIVAGCPLIYSKSGGHIEFAEGSGVGIDDKQWNFKPCDLYSPPSIDRHEIAESMLKIKLSGIDLKEKPSLDIKNVAQQYMNFFISLLENKD